MTKYSTAPIKSQYQDTRILDWLASPPIYISYTIRFNPSNTNHRKETSPTTQNQYIVNSSLLNDTVKVSCNLLSSAEMKESKTNKTNQKVNKLSI